MDTVTQMASRDATMCPVCQEAALARRIRGYPGATDDTPVSAVWKNDNHVTSNEMVEALRAAVISIGEEKLVSKACDVGTHLIR